MKLLTADRESALIHVVEQSSSLLSLALLRRHEGRPVSSQHDLSHRYRSTVANYLHVHHRYHTVNRPIILRTQWRRKEMV